MSSCLVMVVCCGAISAAEPAAAVRLTGIVNLSGTNLALLEITPARSQAPPLKPILDEGARAGDVEVRKIDNVSGRVIIQRDGVEATLSLEGTPPDPTQPGRTLFLHSADFSHVVDVYAMLSGKTVLYPTVLPRTRIDAMTAGAVPIEEARETLERSLNAAGIVVRSHGTKFAVLWEAAREDRFPELPLPPKGGEWEVFPAGMVRFIEADISQVLHMYQELAGRTTITAGSTPVAKFTLRTQTPLDRDEVAHAIQVALALNDIAVTHRGSKFALVAPERFRGVLTTWPAAPAETAGIEFGASQIAFRDAGFSDVAALYARLLGRQVLAADGVPPGRISIRNQTPWTRPEALYALNTVLALNEIRIEPVGESSLQVVSAPLRLTGAHTPPKP